MIAIAAMSGVLFWSCAIWIAVSMAATVGLGRVFAMICNC